MWFKDVIKDVPAQRWIVNRILPEDSLAMLYGGYGTAKTFICMDLAANIAMGGAWREHRIEQCGVIYVGAEGRAGLRKRFKAWAQHNGPTDSVWDIPLVLMQQRVNLMEEEECKAFVEECKRIGGRMESDMGVKLGCVVFDTLARCIPRANENSSEHMGLVVDNVDRIRRQLGNITGLFVHHVGKDGLKGPRGHTGLPAAADTMIELTKDESRLLTARVGKQKDEQDGVRLHFRLKRVELGKNEFGEDETTCVVMEAQDEAKAITRGPILKGAAKVAYQCLTQALLDHGTRPSTTSVPAAVTSAVDWKVWRDYCFRQGLIMSEKEDVKQKAFQNAGKVLRERGWIAISDPWVWQVR
jgi:hypothetical protein